MSIMSESFKLCSNDAYWQEASVCRNNDFTVAFEYGILVLLPTILAILTALFTLVEGYYDPIKPKLTAAIRNPSATYLVAIVLTIAYLLLSVGLVLATPLRDVHAAFATWPLRLVLACRILVVVEMLFLLPAIHVLHGPATAKANTPRTRLQAIWFSLLVGQAIILRSTYKIGFPMTYHADVVLQAVLIALSTALLLAEISLPSLTSPPAGVPLPHLEQRVGMLGRATVFFLIPLQLKGGRESLAMADMLPLEQEWRTKEASKKLQEQIAIMRRSGRKKTKISGGRVFLAIIKAWPMYFFWPLVPKMIYTASSLLDPVLISALVDLVSRPEGSELSKAQTNPEMAWLLVGAFMAVNMIGILALNLVWGLISRCDLTMKAGLTALVFDKLTTTQPYLETFDSSKEVGESKTDQTSPEKPSVKTGQIHDPATLMSVDIEHLNEAGTIAAIYEGLMAIPLMIIGQLMLYQRLGPASLVVIFVLLGFGFPSSWLSFAIKDRQKAWLEATQARVVFMAALVSRLRVVFASSYQPYFLQRALTLRSAEIQASIRFFRRNAIIVTAVNTSTPMATLALFIAARLIEGHGWNDRLTAANIFSSLSIVTILDDSLSILSNMLPSFLAATASLERLDDYLFEDELPLKDPSKPSKVQAEAIRMCNAVQHALEQLPKDKPTSKVIHIVGQSSSGKTTLLEHTLRQLHDGPDTLVVGYAPQNTVLFEDSSIRENIELWDIPEESFGVTASTKDEEKVDLNVTVHDNRRAVARLRMAGVLRFCRLNHDVSCFEEGLETKVSQLSGGQRQRVALARALYSAASIVVLDDSLSALDAITADEIEKNLYGIDVTEDVAGVLSGRIVVWASNKDSRFDESIFNTTLSSDGHFSLNHQVRDRDQQDSIALDQGDERPPITIEKADTPELLKKKAASFDSRLSLVSTKPAADEEIHASRLGIAPYKFWFTNAPRVWVWVSAIIVASCALTDLPKQYILAAWSSQSNAVDGVLPRPGFWLPMMVLAAALPISSVAAMMISVMTITGPRASQQIYRVTMNSLLKTSPYNSLLPSQLRTRFTNDLSVVDQDFARCLINLNYLFNLIGILTTMSIALPWLVLTLPLILIEGWLLEALYLRTSRQIRSMELEVKSSLFAIFAQVTTCLHLLQYLRLEPACIARFEQLFNRAQGPTYSMTANRRFLKTLLSFLSWIITSVFAILVVTLALRGKVSAVLVGVALANVAGMSQLLSIVLTQMAEMETQAVALDRVRRVASLAPEGGRLYDAQGQPARLNPTPPMGSPVLECNDMRLRYKQDSQDILKGFTFQVSRGSRIGICGRSGSGKSSLLAALLRGVSDELITGDLQINGSKREDVDLLEWRKAFSYVSQEPLIWEATVREVLLVREVNELQPANQEEDERLWAALEAVGLAEVFRPKSSGLSTRLVSSTQGQGDDDDHHVLSTSQTHLLAFARTLLEKDRDILLIDELTSNLDVAIEQRTLDLILNSPDLKDRTVLAVSHRIAFLTSFDYILLLEDGQIVERGTPDELLSQHSKFKKLTAGMID